MSNTDKARALAQKGETYRQQGEYDKAINCFNQAIDILNKLKLKLKYKHKHKPLHAWLLAHRGAAYLQAGNTENRGLAIKDLTQSIDLRCTFWAYAQLGEAYRLKLYHQLIFNHSDDKASDKIIKEELDEVIKEEFDKAVKEELDKIHKKAFDKTSNKALDAFNKAIELSDDDEAKAWAYAHRGVVYRFKAAEQKKPEYYQYAVNDFTKAIELSDDYAWAYAYRATVNMILGNNSDGSFDPSNDACQAICLDPTVFGNKKDTELALHHYLNKSYKAAISACKRALEKNPEDLFASYLLAASVVHRNDDGVAEAKAEIEQARYVCHKMAGAALYTLAGLDMLEKNKKQALRRVKQAMELSHEPHELLYRDESFSDEDFKALLGS